MNNKMYFNQRPIHIRMATHPQSLTFLQKIHEANITIKHLKVKDQHTTFQVSRAALPIIRKLRKKYRVKLRIQYANQQDILRIDFVTIVGLLLFLIIPIFASQWIWQVKVESDSPELRVSLEKTLQQELALRPPFIKQSLPDDMAIRQVLLEKHRDLAWVHIQKSGGHIVFVPQKAPELVELPDTKKEPMHLIAAKSGVITHFDIDSGIRSVSPNMTVYEGDLLVSGILTSGNSYTVIGASGSVYADYWLECTFSIPRTVEFVGQETREWHVLFKWMHKDVFQTQYYDEVALPSFLSSFVKVVLEQKTQTVEQQITEDKVTDIVVPLLHQKILQSLPQNTLIKKENLLHVEIDDDTVKGKVLFLINENIAKPQPVNQGE